MDWNKLLCSDQTGNARSPIDQKEEGRDQFQRDFDRIIFSTAFRRLNGKTQVVPFPTSDHTHTRMVHSLETASVGRSLGYLVGSKIISKHKIKKDITPYDFACLLAAACLAHDIGNPPLGHSGEAAISHFFQNISEEYFNNQTEDIKLFYDSPLSNELKSFNGNAMGFRLLTYTSKAESNLVGGMGLSYATLGTFTKYPYTLRLSKDDKYGFFTADRDVFASIAEKLGLIQMDSSKWCRHPLAFLVEAADDICNRIMDFEDGYDRGLLSFSEIERIFKSILNLRREELTHYKENVEEKTKIKYLRARVINKLISQVIKHFIKCEDGILNGKYDGELIREIKASKQLEEIYKLSSEKIYSDSSVVQIEAAGFKVLPGLLTSFFHPALMNTDNDSNENHKKYDSRSKKDRKLRSLIPSPYLSGETQEEKILNIVQYVACMTDWFAVDTFRRIEGIEI